jgi:hypothetical protein
MSNGLRRRLGSGEKGAETSLPKLPLSVTFSQGERYSFMVVQELPVNYLQT